MFSIVYFQGSGWLVGSVRELPGAYAPGADLWKSVRDAREETGGTELE
jgi:hypothetical protein